MGPTEVALGESLQGFQPDVGVDQRQVVARGGRGNESVSGVAVRPFPQPGVLGDSQRDR